MYSNKKLFSEVCEKFLVSCERDKGDFLDSFYLCESGYSKILTSSLFPRKWYHLAMLKL